MRLSGDGDIFLAALAASVANPDAVSYLAVACKVCSYHEREEASLERFQRALHTISRSLGCAGAEHRVTQGSASDQVEEFEELRVFLELQKQRHRKLIVILLGLGALLLSLGCIGFWNGFSSVASAFLAAMGILLCVRGTLSAFTDVDTRDRGEFEAVAREIEADMEKKLRKGRA